LKVPHSEGKSMSKKIQSSYTVENNLFCRSGDIHIGGEKFSTPVKTFELGKPQTVNVPSENFGINEYIRLFPENNVYDVNSVLRKRTIKDYFYGDSNLQLNESLKSIAKSENGLNIFFLGFDGSRFPSDDELRFLASRTFAYSDIIPFPIVRNLSKIVSPNTFNDYLNFLQRVYDEYAPLNNKPLLGIIPKSIADGFYKQIIKFYVDHNITSFAFDFEGAYPGNVYPQILVFFRELIDCGINQSSKESFIYALNPGQGRIAQERESVEARDIISIEYGFDVLGKPLQVGGGAGKQTIDTTERKMRVFDKTDYGYYRLTPKQLEKKYPSDSSIPLNELLREENTIRRNNLSIFNMEQKSLELKQIRKEISKNKLIEYLNKKHNVTPQDKSQIVRMKKEIKIRQSSLFSS
jgi:hypothetical protein